MKNYSDMVNVHVGGVAHLTAQATMPVMALPHGMLQTYPVFNPDMDDKYLADRIYAFPAGPACMMPVGGKAVQSFKDLASLFDRDNEEARPYYYSVWLQDINTDVYYTISRHSGIMEFSFHEYKASDIILYVPNARILELKDGRVLAVGEYQGTPAYGVYEFNCPVAAEALYFDIPVYDYAKRINDYVKCSAIRIKTGLERIQIRFGISLIDLEQAKDNLLREIKGFDFDKVRTAARNEWNELLGRIKVEDGRKEDMEMFYSCLYRSMLRMINFSEYGRYYSGFDKKVHADDGHEFYCNDGMWDTYRSMHPLQMLLEPRVHEDVCESYIRMFEQSGWLHDFPSQDGGHGIMLGSHTTAMFADSLAHGVRFDAGRALEAVRHAHTKGSLIPWYMGPATELDRCYHEKGFFPALPEGEAETHPQVHSFERRQCVSVTLEQAYDDWCAAQLARAVGDRECEEMFLKRAFNYKNMFNPAIGFMAPKTADGRFVEDFDPKICGGQGGRAYFAENNSWIYTLNVQHDIEGLSRLLGSRKALEERMDRLFTEHCGGMKFDFLSQYPDATGLTGQFCMGNEPSFHIPYIYNFLGAPWKTQKQVRSAIRMWFHKHPFGFCGDEDGGALSSWFVFSAMGFYPFCPGSAYYTLTSPLFDKVAVTMPGGEEFTIIAEGSSGVNKYIDSAYLNGKGYNKSYINYDDIKNGGKLILGMARKPNTAWASDESSLPPSYTGLRD